MRNENMLGIINDSGVFANRDDDQPTLESALRARFDDVQVEMVGCVAMFAARRRN